MWNSLQQLRVEALRAATHVVSNGGGDVVVDLVTEAKIIYDWLYSGKDPIVDETE